MCSMEIRATAYHPAMMQHIPLHIPLKPFSSNPRKTTSLKYESNHKQNKIHAHTQLQTFCTTCWSGRLNNRHPTSTRVECVKTLKSAPLPSQNLEKKNLAHYLWPMLRRCEKKQWRKAPRECSSHKNRKQRRLQKQKRLWVQKATESSGKGDILTTTEARCRILVDFMNVSFLFLKKA